jgi:hypothetical protein
VQRLRPLLGKGMMLDTLYQLAALSPFILIVAWFTGNMKRRYR